MYPKQLLGRSGGLIAVGLLIASLLLVLSACSSPQTTFDPKSDATDKIHTLYILIIVISGAIGAAVLIAMGYLMIKFRARPGVKARQIHGNNTLEVLWTLGPILILVMIGVPTVLAIVGATRAPSDDALHVEVVAHQWWWEVNYPGLGPDGGTLTTANELHMPIGREVAISLKSDDVIHSFWVPQLIGKIDSIPGRTNHLEPFTAKEVGVYLGQCAEFCGLAHALMRFRVVVDSLGDFERWVAGMNTPPPAPEAESFLASGQSVFIQNCSSCHAVAGTVAAGRIGPDLSRFGSRLTIGAGIMDNTEENLVEWITNTTAVKPMPEGQPTALAELGNGKQAMPRFDDTLTPAQVEAVAAYLRSMTIE